jgi:PadR family transcriptional regulator, regulatory protein PadR
MSRPSDLVQGTLDVLILSILAKESLHGLAIAQQIRERSQDVLQMSPGSLYPALHKLEHQGLIRAIWRKAESGRRGKYYALARAGERRLEKETADWNRLSKAISIVLKPI